MIVESRARARSHHESVDPAALSPPQDPAPPRSPNSLRRTSVVDIHCDDSSAHLTLLGTGRDLITDQNNRPQEIARARVTVNVELAARTITAISVEPGEVQHATDPLVGLRATSGFRHALRACASELVSSGSLVGLLLDEVPVATIISGSLLRRRPATLLSNRHAGPPIDVCAGWVADGVLATSVQTTGVPPLNEGPIVAPISLRADPHAWHPLPTLPPWSMRRARRIDVRPVGEADGCYELEAFFRDSRVLGDGIERGVHEYAVCARVDNLGRVVHIEAIPSVLPAPECPSAAASVQRLVGVSLSDVRERVAVTFTGTSTCTHLNDTLRALGDMGPLINLLTTDAGQV